MISLFIGLVLLMILTMVFYYNYQNTRISIGGKISTPKVFWLGYTLFNYFIFPVYLFFLLQNEKIEFTLMITIFLFYLRLIVQGSLMFIFKNWIPTYGIIYNAFSVLVILVLIIFLFKAIDSINTIETFLILLFYCQLILILITDTFYAIKFYRIIVDNTKGKKAIWYASEEEKFKSINKITIRNNKFFVLISSFLTLIMLIYDIY